MLSQVYQVFTAENQKNTNKLRNHVLTWQTNRFDIFKDYDSMSVNEVTSPVLAVVTAVRLLVGMTKFDVVSQRGW